MHSVRYLFLSVTLAATACAVATAEANIRVDVPGEDPGPPFYSQVQRTYGPEQFFIPHTSEWAAIPFLRETICIPEDFNLLDHMDIPGAFFCPLTVEGFAVFKNGQPPIDAAPYLHQLIGVDEVEIWFAAWPEVATAAADGDLTILELLALPSLQMGQATFYKETAQPGVERPQGPGNGKIQINASGYLMDGRTFQLSVREQGDDGVSIMRHVRIEIE